VAPSFVTIISPVDALCRILSMPFGPSVDFTVFCKLLILKELVLEQLILGKLIPKTQNNEPKSPTAMAPINADRRAFSPFSSVVPSSKICVGLKDAIVLCLESSKVASLQIFSPLPHQPKKLA
jgi:hypothetical protein